MSLTKPLAVVTGASSGIGLEFARRFAEHGWDLVVCAENRALSRAADDLRRRGADVRQVRADLATYDGVEQLVQAVAATRRPVAAAVLNAGTSVGGAFLDVDLADTARVVDLNVSSTLHLARRLPPGMVDAGAGRLLVVSSVAAEVPGPYQAVYHASKAFLLSFAEALRDELRGTGVTVSDAAAGRHRHRLLPARGPGEHTARGGNRARTAPPSWPHRACGPWPGARARTGGLPPQQGRGLAARLLPHRVTLRAARALARLEPRPGERPAAGYPPRRKQPNSHPEGGEP